jgi:8-oxo-dGTP diphosphatase
VEASIHEKRQCAFVSVYLILRQENRVLLLLRKNTGYCDGFYSLIAGHVEKGESATAAMIREAKEESGIDLSADQIKAVHIMHRLGNRFNMDIFFECSAWQGVICNREPEKCEALQFFSQEELPSNCIDYVQNALRHVSQGEFFSELGWR